MRKEVHGVEMEARIRSEILERNVVLKKMILILNFYRL